MARGRHPHAYAIAGAQAVIRAIQNGAKSGTAPVPRPTYQTIYQTDGGNLVAVHVHRTPRVPRASARHCKPYATLTRYPVSG